MKYQNIITLTLSIILSLSFSFGQEMYPDTAFHDTMYSDSLYDEFGEMDTTWDDFEEPEPETVKNILRQGAQNVGEMGKQTLNELTNKASYEAGQFINRQANKLFDGIKQKLTNKKNKKDTIQSTNPAQKNFKVDRADSVKISKNNLNN